MTIAEIATNLLLHFSPEERSVPDSVTYPGRNAAVLEAINGAFQECFGNGSPWLRWDERGALLKTPAAVTISVTEGSTSGTITGWAAWMEGCTIVIDGHDLDNQIRNGSSTAVLKYPYGGSTGSKNAMVYQDCIPLASDVLAVHQPVRINGTEILPRPSADVHGRSMQDYGAHLDFVEVPVVRQRASVAAGQPVSYWVETYTASDTADPTLRLRLGPANSKAGSIEYRAMLVPPVISSIASTSTLPIPFGFDQTIFLPIARQKLTACPFFRDQGGLEEIGRAYKQALELLNSLHPSKDQGITLRPRF